jgi:hypothetical protein
MAKDITLGDLVRLLAVSIRARGRLMPYQDETPWHTVFYRLKKELPEPKPQFIANLGFDWDGPFPKSQDISDFLQALHWTGSVAALNPSYEQIIVPPGVQERWTTEVNELDPEMAKILERTVELAVEEFPALPAN